MNSLRFLLPLWVGVSSTLASANPFMGTELLSYFGANCRSQGEFTRQALSDSESLVAVLHSIKNDPDCVSVSGAIGQLNLLQNKVVSLSNEYEAQVQIESLRGQELELQSQLNATTDPSVISELQSAIRATQTQRAGILAADSAAKRLQGESVKNTYAQIIQSTDAVFSTLTSNTQCLNKNPSILRQVTSLASAVGSIATVANPALGLGLSAATEFLGRSVEFVRVNRYNRQIRNVLDGSLALSGYKCALESLSDRWCQLDDAEHFIGFKASLLRGKTEDPGLKTAVRLNDREIPAFLDWLATVRTGVPPATSADGSRQSKVFQREMLVRAAEANGIGIISENEPIFERMQSPENKWRVIQNIVSRLTATYCTSVVSSADIVDLGPLQDIYPPTRAAYYLIGLDQIPLREGISPISFCDFDPFSEWPIPGNSYTPNLKHLRERYEAWVSLARNRVNQELTLVLQPDPLKVLTSAFERTSNKWKVAPRDALDQVVEFLQKNRPNNFTNRAFEQIFKDTIRKLKVISDALDASVIGLDPPDPRSTLEKIFFEASLQYGVILFQSRFEMTVRIAMDHYFETLHPNEHNVAAQMLVADSFLDSLGRVKGSDNLTYLMEDVRNAQTVSINNLTRFGETFGRSIDRILKINVTRSETTDRSVGGVYSRDVAKLCLLLSSLPQWPKAIHRSYCEGSSIPPLFEGGPSSPKLTADYLDAPFSKRKCGYRDYFRKSNIYQHWGISF